MASQDFAITLRTRNKEQVERDFDDVKKAGVAAGRGLGEGLTNANQVTDRELARAQRKLTEFQAKQRIASLFDIRPTAGPAELGRRQSAYEQLFGEADAVKQLTEAYSLNRTQRVVAQASVLNFVQQVAAGTPVMRAFVTQASDIPTILAADEGGIAGGLAKVRGLLTPVTVGVTGLTAVLAVGAGAWLSYSSAVAAFDRLGAGSARTLGLTGDQLDEIAVKGAAAAEITVGAAREILTGYVQAGGIGRDVLQGLIALTDDFAAATGREAKDAVGDLAAAFADPAKGAEELARRYGLLTQAQVEQVRQLVDANDKFGAQKLLLEQLVPLLDGSAQKLSGAAAGWAVLTTKIDGAWQALGRFVADVITTDDAERLATLVTQRDYLKSMGRDYAAYDQAIAAIRNRAAEERRAREQMAKDALANIAAQKKADEAEKDAERRKRERAAEAKRLANEAERDRQQELRRRESFIASLQRVISAEARAEEERGRRIIERFDAEQAAGGRRIAALGDRAAFAGDTSAAARLELARRNALREAAADPDLNSRQVAQRTALAVAEEQAAIDAERAELIAAINSGRAQFNDLLSLANALQAVGIDLASEQAAGIIAQVRAQQQVNAGLAEMERFGGQIIDTLFNPNNWTSWGDVGRSVINQLIQEMLVLAAVNPLKNLLFGSALPTLFGGGGIIPGNAMGTPYFGGGLTMLGENGPELGILPRGTRIESNAATRRMLAGVGGGSAGTTVYDLRGAVVYEDLMNKITQQSQAAAAQGAAGGAMLARADMARRQRRVIR